MKKRFLFLLILFLLFTGSFMFADTWYRVDYIADGDTVYLEDNTAVRLLGINAPEIVHEDKKGEPFGEDAKKYLGKIVLGKQVTLEFDTEKKDRYNRNLAYLTLEDGTMVNAKMIEDGYAYVLYHVKNHKYFERLLNLQQQAIQAEKGIWKYWRYRSGTVLANKRSMRFHTMVCRFGKKTGKRNREVFKNCMDAFQEGFAPCRECISAPGMAH